MNLTGKHWAILGAMLGAVALQMSALKTWADASSPAFVAGILLQVGATLKALYTDKPEGDGPRFPVWLLPLLLAAGVTVSGCASAGGPRHVATVSVVTAHATLGAIQDTARLVICDTPGAPTLPKCLTREQHRALSAKLVTAFDLDERAAREVRAWPEGQTLPPTVQNLLAQITAIVNEVLALLPSSPQVDRLKASLGGTK